MSIVQDIRLAFSRRDNALVKLIWLNVLVFVGVVLLEAGTYLSQSPGVLFRVMSQLELSANLGEVARHPWTVLTYAFTHQGFLHILFNMLQLYWFGQLLQEYLGDRRLVSVYVLGALVGAATCLLGYNLIPVLMPYAAAGQLVVGASGAVTAVIVAAATLLPDYTFMLILIGPVRIKWIAAVVIILSIAGLSGNPGGMLAHLGGALLGFVFIKQLQAGRDLGRPVQAVGNFFSRLTSSRPAMRVSSTTRRPETVTTASASGAKKPVAPGQPLQDEIDTILDKISRSGYESLSKEEKQKLFRASQQ
ncbi:rhomboid family intramembrane serine protease [Hymenobacter properus]|uniref:Rhomboid family intramembrane serine protease n=1 Tax=Hymenobacter properus TaxID=2791026 RepID=A0A931BPT4_9BACT|nr:rhomboid family intramembrane serine protease [Hymenobacter properus]MBF9143395.1 rhomboid family intramembrane serine protease [Hymenobacter properus]MBR7722208.1 rhomboid family intramembrane serine protease [Microvirga sp. SRT04]